MKGKHSTGATKVICKIMSIEIELKFLVGPNAQAVLAKWIEQFVSQNPQTSVDKSVSQLTNTYFDSESQVLRQHDMGLRVRGTDGVWEQTIKTRGKAVAGLHQRPEYNISLDNNQLNLSLFDSQILPESYSATQLQSIVEPLFTTEFNRTTWLISHPSCVFEMVYDTGTISAYEQGIDGDSVDISEVEIELKSGDMGVIYAFARKLLEYLGQSHDDYSGQMRIGAFSKAARGYQLYFAKPLAVKSYMKQVALEASDTIEQAFVKTIEYGLGFMQHHEQVFCENLDAKALRRFDDGVALIRHCFRQYPMLIAEPDKLMFDQELAWVESAFDWVEHSIELEDIMSKTGKYRKRLELNSALADLVADEGNKDPDKERIRAFFYQPRYNKLMLDIGRWLLEKGWRGDKDINLNTSSQSSLQLHSCQMLSSSWRSMLDVLPYQHQFSIDDYIEHHSALKNSLLTGICVGGLYSAGLRDVFRDPWVDLSSGIDELKTLRLLQGLAKQIDDSSNNSTLNWLEQQIDSLLHAMEQSRTQAIKMKPYWAES